MKQLLDQSLIWGFVFTVGSYMIGMEVKRKLKWRIINPLLVAVIIVIAVLAIFQIDYQSYYQGAKYINYFLTPATVCLAIPLYKQLNLLKENLLAVFVAILSGVAASGLSIFAMSKLFGLTGRYYVSLLPKSVTTAIAVGVAEAAGGIVTLTLMAIMITGLLGNIFGELVFRLFKIHHSVARGLALGTAAHAIGTAKALELGEIEGAMSSLSIAVAGLMTVIAVPLMSGWIS